MQAREFAGFSSHDSEVSCSSNKGGASQAFSLSKAALLCRILRTGLSSFMVMQVYFSASEICDSFGDQSADRFHFLAFVSPDAIAAVLRSRFAPAVG